MLGKQTLNPSRDATERTSPSGRPWAPPLLEPCQAPPSPWTGGWTLGADATERLWPPDLRRVLLEATTKYCANGSCTAEKSSGGVCGGGGGTTMWSPAVSRQPTLRMTLSPWPKLVCDCGPRTCACTRTRIRTCTCTNTCTYRCTNTCTCESTHTCTCTCGRASNAEPVLQSLPRNTQCRKNRSLLY